MTNGGGLDTELSRALRALREAAVPAKLNQVEVTARTGISQPRLSRIEQGKALPTDDEVVLLARLYGATPDRADELVQLAADLRAGIKDERLVVQRGSTLAMAQRWHDIEQESATVRGYHPAVVLGVLQTPAYAAIAMRQPPDSPEVQTRLRRHRSMLTEPGRRWRLIQTEGALRQTVGSAAVMVEQLAAIAVAADAPNVELGVIPARQPIEHQLVGSGFHVYDNRAVAVGFEVAAATLTRPSDIEDFAQRFADLERLAVFGHEARALLARIHEDYSRRAP